MTIYLRGFARSRDKLKTSPVSQSLWQPKLADWWLNLSEFYPYKWFCKITWQTNVVIYPLTQSLWLSILAWCGYTIRSSTIPQYLWSPNLAGGLHNNVPPSIKSHYPLIKCSSNFDFSLQFVGLECKQLSGHWLVDF